MLKKNITYTDFNGEERNEDFYFSLNEAELAELELSVDGGLSQTLANVVKAKDTPTLVKLFKKIILLSYGIKSPDGKYFEKSEDISKKFTFTNAYSVLFMELATDAKKASDFVNGILPSNRKVSEEDIQKELKKIENK